MIAAEPEFGEPVAELPNVRTYANDGYWRAVVAHAKAHPGQWIPLLNPIATKHRLASIASAKNGARGTSVPVPLKDPAVRLRYAQKTLYFRYDGTGEV